MAKQMQGKVCVITGGAGSIGQASAKLLHAEGAKVMLTDLNEAALKEAAARMQGMLAAQGMTEDEILSDFKEWQASRRK